MAHEMNVPISEVAVGGPGVTFIAYPKALSLMPTLSKAMSIMFFLMLIFLGLDSQFVGVEGFTTQFMDAFPNLFNFKNSRAWFITVYCIGCFLVGLIFVTEGGMYFFQIMDFYSASGIVLLFICLCESLAIAYFYGGMRYIRDLKYMLGTDVPLYFPICWYVITPFTCCLIAIFFLINEYDPVHIIHPLIYGDYVYPMWTSVLGWGITFTICGIIPISLVIQVIRYCSKTNLLGTAQLKAHQVHPESQQPYIITNSSPKTQETSNVHYDATEQNVRIA